MDTSFSYDWLNRLTEEGRRGEGLRAGVRESGKLSTFLYYNGEILAECNGESMPIRRRLPGFGVSILQTLEDGRHHACHQDEQGSTAYITGRDGAVENCYIYDAFGNTLEKKEGIRNRILYTGQQYDQETGQYYLRARYYNPVVGRFTQEDTYRGDGLNLYAYCKNNPVVYYDPSGHDQVAKPSNGPETTNTAGVEKGNSGNFLADVEGSSYSGEEWYNYFVDTYGKENVQGTFFNEIKYEPTSGVNFTPTKGKTTTILGRYDMDTQYIFDETGNIKSLSYDGHEGGFNLLNVPDDLSNVPGGDFWNDYNVPFLDEAIGRNDVFSLATEPNQASMYRVNKDTGLLELSGFGKEIKYLESKGYVLDKALM